MKNWFKSMAIAAALVSGATTATQAQQERGQRPDPEEMRQRMNERMKEQFGVTDDAEWKVIEGKIQKVNDARRAVGGGMGFGGMAFGGGRGRGGGQGGQGGDADRGNRGGGGGGRFGGEQSAEVQDLQKAIDAKASADEIKAKLAKVREARKANEAKLETAQDDLRKVLSVRQEAVAVMMGLLK